MGTVPQSYYDFITHYAPYFYVITTNMTQDPPSGQRNVTVADGTKFQSGYPVQIKDDVHSEWNTVSSVAGNVVTMQNDLQYTYYVAKNGVVEGPDPSFGRGVCPAAFAIDFLCQAYSAAQFSAYQADTLAKIQSLADFVVSQQCTNQAKKAYGGFPNTETGTQYWSIDAGRCIPPLLKAYALTNTASYLNAAKLAGLTFLYNMQHNPALLGVHDKYYGGFARYVDINDNWSQPVNVEDLYDLIGLQMLAQTYDVANASTYQAMMSDAVGFLRSGFEQLYLWFDPKPSGDGNWHRVGTPETQVYDDPIGFALLGLYTYEGWSVTCQRVYSYVQSIRASAQYPAYNPAICWPGYIDVVTRFPACAYYDAITSGILWKIRAAHDKPSLALSMQVINNCQTRFMYWGPIFTDYSPITAQKAVANTSWLAQLFLNYADPVTDFTRVLDLQGENLLLYSVQEAADQLTYSQGFSVKGMVSLGMAGEAVIEPGYILQDHITVYTFLPVRVHDKFRRAGVDYEVLTVQLFDLNGDPQYYKSVCRRLISQ
jgi:hypothetical protein